MPTDVRKGSLRIPKDSYRNPKDAYRIPRDSYPKIAPKRLPNRIQNGFKMAPKWLPPEGSWSPLGRLLAIDALILPLFLQPGGLLERSWTHSGPIQSALERPLGAPRRISRQFSTILGAKRLPKWSPGGSQIESRSRLEPKKRISQKPLFFFFDRF